MDLKNKGKFSVVFDEAISKYVIHYNERGNVIILENYVFVDYDIAEDYVKNHLEELDEVITKFKEDEQRKLEEEEAERQRKEEKEKKAKEEKEKKKKKFIYNAKRVLAGFLAGVVALVGGHFIGKGISSLVKNSKNNSSIVQDEDETSDLNFTYNGDIDSIINQDEELTVEIAFN